MATNRIKQSVEGSAKKRSPLTSAGKKEEILANDEIVVDEQKNKDLTPAEINVPKDEKKENDIESDKAEVKTETIVENIEPVASESSNTFGFVIEKKAEPDIKKQKMYNLKLGNIKKVKEIADATGMSESAIIDFLIENGSKVLTIK